jgi:hypothetical protein
MTKIYIILLLLLLICIYELLYSFNFPENFTTVNSNNKTVDTKEDNTANITAKDPGQNQGILHDPLFSDVIFFQNDKLKYNDDGTYVGDTGFDKCITGGCTNGKCVEYGITGNAYCFPNDSSEGVDEYTKALQKMLVTDPNKGV